MKRLLPFAVLLALATCARGEEPAIAPPVGSDYRALYLAANDAAARWKALAEQMQAERDVARKERDGARRQFGAASLPLADPAPEPVPTPKKVPARSEFVLAKKERRLLPVVNEWMTFYGADALAVRVSIGPGYGAPHEFPTRRGLEGSGNNLTLIHDNGRGERLYYVDTVRRQGDGGIFMLEQDAR